jgi:hypothetical protein
VIDMNRTLKRLSLSAALIGFAAIPAQAQTGWGSLGINAAWMNPAHHGRGAQTDIGFDETVGVGGNLDFWFGQTRRWGLGLAGSYSGWNEWDTDFGGDFGHPVSIGMYDASLQLRLAAATPSTRILPYLSLGVGAVTTNPDDQQDSPFPTNLSICSNGGGATCNFVPGDVVLTTETQTQLAAVGGAGIDWFLTPSVAIRTELKDYWTDRSPYRSISTGAFHDGGHNLQFSGGLAMYLGRASVQEPGFVREEPVIVAPAPQPAPPPAPAPPPPPAEEMVQMCVVNPDGFTLQTVEAIRVPSENRIYVTENGQRVLFETAHPAMSPIYVKSATWYMNDQPLVIGLESSTRADRNRIELVTFGSPAQRNAADLVFVGTIEGTPVYATAMDVAPFRSRLEGQFATTTDLATILRADAQLARDFGAVKSYYVAVEPNCVFQPVSVTNYVRRTRG